MWKPKEYNPARLCGGLRQRGVSEGRWQRHWSLRLWLENEEFHKMERRGGGVGIEPRTNWFLEGGKYEIGLV